MESNCSINGLVKKWVIKLAIFLAFTKKWLIWTGLLSKIKSKD